jgi:MFS family permease
MVIMVTLNSSAGLAGQVIGRVVHYKRLPMIGLVLAIATLLVMGWNAQTLTPWSVAGLLALLGVGFGPVPPVAMVSLQNTVEAHHLGTAVGTLSFLRNLCATMIVAIFGAIVLMGSARVLPRGVDGLALPAQRFAYVFYLAAASLAVSLIALLLMEEKPLRSDGPAAAGGDTQG